MTAARRPPAAATAAELGAWGERGGQLHLPRQPASSRLVIDLMAGTRGVARAAARAGLVARSWELEASPLQDAMRPSVQKQIRELAGCGRLALVFIALVCTSWSRARRGPRVRTRPGWPGPIRDAMHVLGLPDLSQKDAKKVELGNQQALWAANLFEAVAETGTPVVLENPASSMLWLHPRFVRLLKQFSYITFDHCAYGSRFRKRTGLLFANVDLVDVATRHCRGRGRCEFSGLPHEVVEGRDENKNLRSKLAAEYPSSFCDEVIRLARARIRLM